MYYISRINPVSNREYWLAKNGKWVSRDTAVCDDIEIKGWKRESSAINAARKISAEGIYSPIVNKA